MTRRSTVHLLVTAPLRKLAACPNCRAQLYGTIPVCPKCDFPLPRGRVTENWVEDHLDGGWIAAYRLMMKGPRPVVAEVRLFPDDASPSRSPGRWTEDVSALPPEGIPAHAMRAVRLKVPRE